MPYAVHIDHASVRARTALPPAVQSMETPGYAGTSFGCTAPVEMRQAVHQVRSLQRSIGGRHDDGGAGRSQGADEALRLGAVLRRQIVQRAPVRVRLSPYSGRSVCSTKLACSSTRARRRATGDT